MSRRSPLRLAALAAALAAPGCGHVVAGGPPAPRAVAAPAPAPAGIDERALDPSVSPCADFYQYACGGWLAATPIPEDQATWSRGFGVLRRQRDERLRALLERDATAPPASEPYAEALGDFWAACMDEAQIERADLEPLAAELARVKAVTDPASLADALAELHLEGVGAFFAIGPKHDPDDATQVIASVEPGSLGMPDRDDYFAKGEPRRRLREEYLGHLERLFGLAGETPADARRDAATVFAIERAVAEASLSAGERRTRTIFYRLGRADLEGIAPSFPWDRYFTGLGIPDVTTIHVAEPDVLRAVSRLVRSTETPDPRGPRPSERAPIATGGRARVPPLADVPMASLRTYLRARLLVAASPRLSSRFVKEHFRWRRALTGADRPPPRWRRCVRATEGAMGEALGRSFVAETLGAESKARARQIIAAIEARMRGRLERLPWMDAPTRARALEKLGLVANKVGFPEAWRGYAGLRVDRSGYLRNALAAEVFEARRQLAKIGKPVDRDEWKVTPAAVNAHYDPSLNEMVFPAGILQPPFYSDAASAAVNFGGIGMVMGHELTHGFDDHGRQFDGRGNLADGWSKAALAELDARSACVSRQYEAYVLLDGLHVDGRLTLGENLADLGGVSLAYEALRDELAGRPPALRGRFTPAQEFFLAYAQAWCTKTRPEALRLAIATNPHSPARFRVVGPLSNMPEFAEAFSCAPGSAMVRPAAERCEVW